MVLGPGERHGECFDTSGKSHPLAQGKGILAGMVAGGERREKERGLVGIVAYMGVASVRDAPHEPPWRGLGDER